MFPEGFSSTRSHTDSRRYTNSNYQLGMLTGVNKNASLGSRAVVEILSDLKLEENDGASIEHIIQV
jgi:hypothetical protein